MTKKSVRQRIIYPIITGVISGVIVFMILSFIEKRAERITEDATSPIYEQIQNDKIRMIEKRCDSGAIKDASHDLQLVRIDERLENIETNTESILGYLQEKSIAYELDTTYNRDFALCSK